MFDDVDGDGAAAASGRRLARVGALRRSCGAENVGTDGETRVGG